MLLTCVLLVAGGVNSGPIAEAAASLLDRPSLSDVAYRPLTSSWLARHYLYGGRLPVDRDSDADYSPFDNGLPPVVVKRSGNGAWIWMPAQGYVSVSKSHQATAGDVSGKHGRIMRYGK